MTEKDLIKKLQGMKEVKPSKDWVVLTKQRILEEQQEVKYSRFNEYIAVFKAVLYHKYAFASLVAVAVVIGTFGFSLNSMPGDKLFTLKKITENSRAVFVSEENQVRYDLNLVNKRLDDLTAIAESNSVRNLASAIEETQSSAAKAADSLREVDEDIVAQVREIEEKTDKIKALGVEIGDSEKELNTALSKLVENQIQSLEEKSLTEEQEDKLEEIKADYEAENYSSALEKILLLSQ